MICSTLEPMLGKERAFPFRQEYIDYSGTRVQKKQITRIVERTLFILKNNPWDEVAVWVIINKMGEERTENLP